MIGLWIFSTTTNDTEYNYEICLKRTTHPEAIMLPRILWRRSPNSSKYGLPQVPINSHQKLWEPGAYPKKWHKPKRASISSQCPSFLNSFVFRNETKAVTMESCDVYPDALTFKPLRWKPTTYLNKFIKRREYTFRLHCLRMEERIIVSVGLRRREMLKCQQWHQV